MQTYKSSGITPGFRKEYHFESHLIWLELHWCTFRLSGADSCFSVTLPFDKPAVYKCARPVRSQ